MAKASDSGAAVTEELTKADLAALVIWRGQPPKVLASKQPRWTLADRRDLRLMLEDGKDRFDIAYRLGRSPEAVRWKIYRMREDGAL